MRKGLQYILDETNRIKEENSVVGKIIDDALKNKTIVHDKKSNRLLAITESGRIEVDDTIVNALEISARSWVENFKNELINKGYLPENVGLILMNFENLYSANIRTDEILKANKELNNLLVDGMRNGNNESVFNILIGIHAFFKASRENLPKGRRYFKNLDYTVDNEKEARFSRNEFISNLLKDGVFSYHFMINSGVLEDFDLKSMDELLRKQEILTYEELEDAFIRNGIFEGREQILQYYLEKDRSFFFKFIRPDELMRYVIDDKIKAREIIGKVDIDEIADFEYDLLEQTFQVETFPKNIRFVQFIQENGKTEKYITKEFLMKLDREKFIKLVLSQNIKYKIPFKSIDYINLYGKLNSEDLLVLQQNGQVNAEHYIKLITFESIKVRDENEYINMIRNQIKFYDINRLEELMNEGKLNGKFVELFNDLLNNHLTEEQRKEYFEKFISDLQNKENDAGLLINLALKGIDFPSDLDYQIPQNDLFDMYLQGEITEQQILELYRKKLIDMEMLKEVYSSEQLEQLYRNDILPVEAINMFTNRAEFIKGELDSKMISLAEILRLYSFEDGINIEEFEQIIEGYRLEEESIAEYLSDDISANKVDDLFTHYYISHDDLSNLVSRGIITQNQADEYAQKISNHEEYESLFNGENGFVVLTRETDSKESATRGEKTKTNRRASKIKNSPELQQFLLEEIGFDNRILQLVGYNNSLDGYKVCPSEDYKLMVFINEENVGNATYVMSLEQGMYFLNNLTRNRDCNKTLPENGKILKSSVTKGALRETEHVKVKNASRGWGANVVDSMKKLSPAFKARLKQDDAYSKKISDIIEEIKDDYDMRRE